VPFTQQRGADRPAEIAERSHMDVRGTGVGEQVWLHRLRDTLGTGMPEPDAQPTADDHALDIKQIDSRRNPRA